MKPLLADQWGLGQEFVGATLVIVVIGLRLLLTCDRERTFEIRFRFRRVRLGRLECDFSSRAVDFSFP